MRRVHLPFHQYGDIMVVLLLNERIHHGSETHILQAERSLFPGLPLSTLFPGLTGERNTACSVYTQHEILG